MPAKGPGFEDPEYDWYGSTFYLNEDGLAYGIQGGYNWQYGATVYGVEADFSGYTNSADTLFATDDEIENDLNWMASLRGRAGIGLDRTLLYFTGGLAVADFDRSWIEFEDEPDSWPDLGDTKVGVIGGFGVEHAFSNRWTARFEGLLAHFDENETVNEDEFSMLTSDTVATARLAINYRFGEQPDAGVGALCLRNALRLLGFLCRRQSGRGVRDRLADRYRLLGIRRHLRSPQRGFHRRRAGRLQRPERRQPLRRGRRFQSVFEQQGSGLLRS